MKTCESTPSGIADRNHAALLIIDVQQGLFSKSTPIYQAEALLRNINILVDRAHLADAPVFYVQHSDQKTLVSGSQSWQLHPSLHPTNADYIIHKQHGNAFEETGLDEALKSSNIDSLVVTGLVTQGCIRATCIGARKLGYRVILVQDAHSNYSQKAAQVIEQWNQKLGAGIVELASTAQIEFT